MENRRALQLQDERRGRLHAKQELLKDPTKKVLTFDGQTGKQKKKDRKSPLDAPIARTRLSELIQQVRSDDADEEEQTDGMEMKEDVERPSIGISQPTLKRKRPKSKSKGEIRDRVDRLIAKTRNKLPMPERKKSKWFE